MTQTLDKPARNDKAGIPPASPRARRWSRREFYQLLADGFFTGQRVEFLFGRIVEMPAQGNAHSVSVELIDSFVRSAFSKGYRFRVQMPLKLKPGSDPEPDLAVVKGDTRDATDHPQSAELVVEVSDSTLAHDRRKARLYARNGIADFWIINLVERRIEVHRQPLPGGGQKGGPAYGSFVIFRGDEKISPLAVPHKSIKVADLFPKAAKAG